MATEPTLQCEYHRKRGSTLIPIDMLYRKYIFLTKIKHEPHPTSGSKFQVIGNKGDGDPGTMWMLSVKSR